MNRMRVREKKRSGGFPKTGECIMLFRVYPFPNSAHDENDLKFLQTLNEDGMSRLKGERDAAIAARDARERDRSQGGDDFIPLGGKVRRPGRTVLTKIRACSPRRDLLTKSGSSGQPRAAKRF